jgi:two-component system, chemotaxis family, protein-glutamate methylesterase/glutaminase
MIKVIIADDSALMRKALSKILESSGIIDVVAIARNGEDVIKKAKDFRPDVITMDINMPVMDGLTALKCIVDERICPVIIISSSIKDNNNLTLVALESGAFDFIEKPSTEAHKKFSEIGDELIEKVKAAAEYKQFMKTKPEIILPSSSFDEIEYDQLIPERGSMEDSGESLKAIAIGISTGGPKTIHQVIPLLPQDLNAVVFLVQHMPPNFTAPFAQSLNRTSSFNVVEAEASTPIQRGTVYVGKGGFHLALFKKSNGEIVTRLLNKPEHRFKPSVDIMMESVLKVFGKNTIGVLMTGMGSDGADAMAHIKERGGYTIAESEETCVVFGMPKEAIKRGGASIVLPSNKIADEIIRVVSS